MLGLERSDNLGLCVAHCMVPRVLGLEFTAFARPCAFWVRLWVFSVPASLQAHFYFDENRVLAVTFHWRALQFLTACLTVAGYFCTAQLLLHSAVHFPRSHTVQPRQPLAISPQVLIIRVDQYKLSCRIACILQDAKGHSLWDLTWYKAHAISANLTPALLADAGVAVPPPPQPPVTDPALVTNPAAATNSAAVTDEIALPDQAIAPAQPALAEIQDTGAAAAADASAGLCYSSCAMHIHNVASAISLLMQISCR